MAIIASDSGSAPRPLIEAGTHLATCFYMVHIGTITENIKGKDSVMNKVRIGWELPNLMHVFDEKKGEQPMSIYEEFNLSMNEKATLRKTLESWRGKPFTEQEAKGFDIENLLGKSCLINVTHKVSAGGKTYARVSAVMPLMKGMEKPKQINDTVLVNYDNMTEEVFSKIPDFIKDKMKTSKEFEAWADKNMGSVSQDLENNVPPPSDDDMPF